MFKPTYKKLRKHESYYTAYDNLDKELYYFYLENIRRL